MYTPNEQESMAISLMKSEITNWEEGRVNITPDVFFMMKNVVNKARKNYFGYFKSNTDPITGRKKLFIPLTEWLVEDIVKNVDIDSKDILVKAANPASHEVASVFRYVLHAYLKKINFGKVLNNLIRLMCIDGTAFCKVWREGDDIKCKAIDRMNIICDPSANELCETPIIERNVLTIPEFKEEAFEAEWASAEEVSTSDIVNRTGFSYDTAEQPSQIPMVEVYERYGWFPKFIATGAESDREEYIYGLIVISNIKNSAVVHLVKELEDDDAHPYTIFKYKDIWNRLDGRGVAEMVFNLQAYINEIVNTRINTARIAQMGLFKLRGGVTPQQFKRLFQTSAIKLKGRNDEIERLDTGTVDPSSYRDEEVGKGWATAVTGAFDNSSVTASTPATNALVQERGSKAGANLIQENFGLALQVMLEKKLVPLIKKVLKKGEVIRITGNAADFAKMQEKWIENRVNDEANKFIKAGGLLTEEELVAEKERLTVELTSQGKDRYIEITDQAFDTDYAVEVVVGDDQLNPALLAQSLTQALSVVAQFPDSRIDVNEVAKEVFDSLGLDGNRLIQSERTQGEAQAATEAAQAEQAAQQAAMPNEATMNPTPNSRPVV